MIINRIFMIKKKKSRKKIKKQRVLKFKIKKILKQRKKVNVRKKKQFNLSYFSLIQEMLCLSQC